MSHEPIRLTAGTEWVLPGSLPRLTRAQAKLALEVCLLSTPECVFLTTDEPPLAGFDLASGRSALVRPELVRQDRALRMTAEEVHEDDVLEVTGIYRSIVTRYPEVARSMQALSCQEVA